MIAGNFDPLTATLARDLATTVSNALHIGDGPPRVLAAVFENREALLPAEARSVLVAALRSVESVVVISPDALDAFAPETGNVRVIWSFESDIRSSAELTELVLGGKKPIRPAEAAF